RRRQAPHVVLAGRARRRRAPDRQAIRSHPVARVRQLPAGRVRRHDGFAARLEAVAALEALLGLLPRTFDGAAERRAMNARIAKSARAGLTLIELVMALALLMLLMIAVFQIFDRSLSLWRKG